MRDWIQKVRRGAQCVAPAPRDVAFATSQSPFDPHAVPLLRDWLADNFAARFAAALPAVAANLRRTCATGVTRAAPGTAQTEILRNADGLFRCSLGMLQETVSEQMRSRFDIRFDPAGDWFDVTARLQARVLGAPGAQAGEETAIAQSTQRIGALCGVEVAALTRWLGALVARDLAGAKSPVAPRLFVRTLMDTFAALGCPAPTRIALLGACDPVLQEFLPPLYASANAMLRERGVALAESSR